MFCHTILLNIRISICLNTPNHATLLVISLVKLSAMYLNRLLHNTILGCVFLSTSRKPILFKTIPIPGINKYSSAYPLYGISVYIRLILSPIFSYTSYQTILHLFSIYYTCIYHYIAFYPLYYYFRRWTLSKKGFILQYTSAIPFLPPDRGYSRNGSTRFPDLVFYTKIDLMLNLTSILTMTLTYILTLTLIIQSILPMALTPILPMTYILNLTYILITLCRYITR